MIRVYSVTYPTEFIGLKPGLASTGDINWTLDWNYQEADTLEARCIVLVTDSSSTYPLAK